MNLNLDDLPPDLRAKVIAKLDPDDPIRKQATKKGKRSRVGDSKVATDGHCQCGEPFTNVTKWERHSDQLGRGHRRFEIRPPTPDPTSIPPTDPNQEQTTA